MPIWRRGATRSSPRRSPPMSRRSLHLPRRRKPSPRWHSKRSRRYRKRSTRSRCRRWWRKRSRRSRRWSKPSKCWRRRRRCRKPNKRSRRCRKRSRRRRDYRLVRQCRHAVRQETPMSVELGSLLDQVERALAPLEGSMGADAARLTLRETGTVLAIGTGIASVSGLSGTGFEELLRFPGDLYGIAFDLTPQAIGVVLLGDSGHLRAGDAVARTGRVMDVGVGTALLGRVINPLGRPLDGGAVPLATQRLPIERPAPPIMQRAAVGTPLQTGVKAVDALVPIGRGQRELILGDRQTGKTALAIDTILHQRGQDVVCVYCAIGQRASALAKTLAVLRAHDAMAYTVVVASEGNEAPGLNYITPYAATSVAEFFMEAGRDVLIVYDDLTQHARSYRELSLLLRRPPGREAFPGDIFYLHARLLERAARLDAAHGGGSLSALPIVETEAQNISAYIPTNLISITDGQVYLSPALFELGVLPAIDVGLSVSRVGGKAQRPAYRAVASDLKLGYAQFQELESFARFGARLDDAARARLEHGRRIRACLQQQESAPVPAAAQIAILLALNAKLFDAVPLAQMAAAQEALIAMMAQQPPAVRDALLLPAPPDPALLQVVLVAATAALAVWSAQQVSVGAGATGVATQQPMPQASAKSGSALAESTPAPPREAAQVPAARPDARQEPAPESETQPSPVSAEEPGR